MKFAECVNNVSTFIDLKRLANEYVIDYSNDLWKNKILI